MVVEGHGSISLEVVDVVLNTRWLVDWQLLVVDSDSVSVGVWVREESRLQDWVGRWLESWYQVGRVKGNLLHLGKVVLDVSVELEDSQLVEWESVSWPSLGQVQYGELILNLEGLLRSHVLVVDLPLGELASLNGVEQVELMSIWGGSIGLLVRLVVLDTLLAQDVDLAVVP